MNEGLHSGNSQLISLAEASTQFGFNQAYLATLARKGRLRAQKLGSIWVTTPADMAAYISSRKKVGVYRDGLNWGWPYPVGQVVRIPVATQTLMIDDFWLRIPDAMKGKPLSDLLAPSTGLNPARDGALLTGDRAIMHAEFKVRYRIDSPEQFFRKVRVEKGEDWETQGQQFLKSVVESSAVASAARMTADQIAKGRAAVASAVRLRAQETLDRLDSGIRLEEVISPITYYPLQVKNAVNNVQAAANVQNEKIQLARKEQQETLNGAAGPAWEKLRAEIARLDQVPDGQPVDTSRIEAILVADAAGRAGEIINQARQERERIVLSTLARQNEFQVLLASYRANPNLFRQTLLKTMLKDLYAQQGVKKWLLPDGAKQLVLWLNPDPKESREAEAERIRKSVGADRR